MSDYFISPYQFLPLDHASEHRIAYDQIKSGKHSHIRHDKHAKEALSGRILCSLTTTSPCAFLDSRSPPAPGTESGPAVSPYQSRQRNLFTSRCPGLTNQTGTGECIAVPPNTIKSAISRAAEFISASSLRALENTEYNRRDEMKESCKAIGVLHTKDGQCELQPLAMVGERANRENTDIAPNSRWENVFDLSIPVKQRTVSYLGYYKNPNNELSSEFNASPPLYTSSQFQTNSVFWYLKTEDTPRCRNNIILECKARSALSAQREDDTYSRGLLYITGGAGQHEHMPDNKVHELFIPFERVVGSFKSVSPRVLAEFDDIANQQKLYAAREQENAALRDGENQESNARSLPFMPVGYRNNIDRAHLTYPWQSQQRDSRLADGDLVYFDVDPHGNVTRVSYSAIWRQRVPGDTWSAFAALPHGKKNLPWHCERQHLTPAETLFGTVEMQSSPATESASNTSRNLKGRVNVSAAFPRNGSTEVSEPCLLRELATPKPSSRQMYWQTDDHKFVDAEQFKLGTNAQPNGVKVYVCYTDDEIRAQPWLHARHEALARNQNDATLLKETRRCAIVPLIKSNQTFDFHIDFNNLSKDELGLLLLAINPHSPPDSPQQTTRPPGKFYHRIGYGKPIGLGHATMTVQSVCFVDRQQRYTAQGQSSSKYSHIEVGSLDNFKDYRQGEVFQHRYKIEKNAIEQQNVATRPLLPYQSTLALPENLAIWRNAGNPMVERHSNAVSYPYSVNHGQSPHNSNEGFKWFVLSGQLGKGVTKNQLAAAKLQPLNATGTPTAQLAKISGNKFKVSVTGGHRLSTQQLPQLQNKLREVNGFDAVLLKTNNTRDNQIHSVQVVADRTVNAHWQLPALLSTPIVLKLEDNTTVTLTPQIR